MKKKFKNIFSVVLTTAVVCSSALTQVYATETIYSEDFEFGLDRGINVGLPELKVYGTNLIDDWSFESGTANWVATVGSFTQKYWDHHSGSNAGLYTYNSSSWGHGIRCSLSSVRPNITKGLYEVSAWIKGRNDSVSRVSLACCTRALSADADGSVTATDVPEQYWKINREYCSSSPLQLTTSGWQKLTGYIVFTDTPDENAEYLSLFFAYRAGTGAVSGESGFYIDDVQMRKVENAEILNGSDMPGDMTKVAHQTNVPYLHLSSCAGRTTTATVAISNSTNSAINIAVATALFESDGETLKELLNIRTASVQPGMSYLNDSFTAPADITDDCVVKCFVWDNFDDINPFTNVLAHLVARYKTAGFVDAIPNAKGWNSTSIHPTYASWRAAYPEYLDRLCSEGASSGVNSMYLPYPTVLNNSSIVYKEIENLEANTTYTLSFDLFALGGDDPTGVGVSKGSMSALNGTSDTANMINLTQVSATGFTTYDNQSTGGGIWTRIHKYPAGWGRLSYTFTTTDAGTYSIGFRKLYDGYSTKGNGNIFGGCYIDNITITKD